MVECPVDRGRDAGIVADDGDVLELEVPHDGFEILLLAGEGVEVALWFVRGAPAEEVEGDDVTAGQAGDQRLPELGVVGEAVKQDDRRSAPRILLGGVRYAPRGTVTFLKAREVSGSVCRPCRPPESSSGRAVERKSP